MRQQNGGEFGEIFDFVPLQPENFRRGEAGRNRVAGERDQPRRAAELIGQDLAFLRRGSVAPQLGRPHHGVLLVERHQPMLLAAHANASDFLFPVAELLCTRRHRGVHRMNPIRRILLEMPRRQSVDHPVFLRGMRDDRAAVGVEDDALGALGAAVKAEEKHGWSRRV